MNKTIVITVLVAAVVSAVVVGMFGGSSPTVVEKVIEKIGATPGSDFNSPITVGGSGVYGYSSRINAASSTGACRFYSPGATTTLAADGLRINADAATGTRAWFAHIFQRDVQPAQYATTTATYGLGLLDGFLNGTIRDISPTFTASATPTEMRDRLVAPGSLIVVGFSGLVNSGNTLSWGQCQLMLTGTN